MDVSDCERETFQHFSCDRRLNWLFELINHILEPKWRKAIEKNAVVTCSRAIRYFA